MTEETNDLTPPAKKSLIARVAPVVVIAGALGLFFSMGWHEYFSLDSLRDNRETLQGWVEASPARAMGIFVLIYAAAVAISFPGASILTVFGGFLFGLWPGVPLIVTGATLGAAIIFLVSKSALGDALSSKVGCLLYTSPSPRDRQKSRMPSSA